MQTSLSTFLAYITKCALCVQTPGLTNRQLLCSLMDLLAYSLRMMHDRKNTLSFTPANTSVLAHYITAVDLSNFTIDDPVEIPFMDSTRIWTLILFSPRSVPLVGAFAVGDMGKERLYVARSMFIDIFSIGHYKSNTAFGWCFMIDDDFRTSQTMVIFVVL